MHIVQINTGISGGGAEKICALLHENYLSAGLDSCVVVRGNNKNQKNLIYLSVDEALSPWQKWIEWLFEPICNRSQALPFFGRVFQILYGYLKFFPRRISSFLGRENFYYPASRHILERYGQKPDIIHAHNLHGEYFDLSTLTYYSKKNPFLITMHDNWLLTGHCAYFFDCTRWVSGCGRCPDLNIYPSIRRDATAFNWKRKRKIYSKSRLYIAAPSQWMIDCLQKSVLYSFVRKAKVIPNGIDTSVFKPQNKITLRQKMGLPQDAYIFTFVANNPSKNPFKDYDTLIQSLHLIQRKVPKKMICLVVGDTETAKLHENLDIRNIPYTKEQKELAKYYAAADTYLHAAKAENMPLTILEAMACGTPVVATAVGGIPEIIESGKNGFLVAKGDANAMANKIVELVTNKALHSQLSIQARKDAVQKFSLKTMVSSYLDYYTEIIDDFQSISLVK